MLVQLKEKTKTLLVNACFMSYEITLRVRATENPVNSPPLAVLIKDVQVEAVKNTH